MSERKNMIPFSEEGSNKTLEELSKYRRLGSPEEIMANVKKQSECANKLAEEFDKIKVGFSQATDAIACMQATLFLAINDKLVAEGVITDDMDESDVMDLVLAEYEKKYKNADLSEIRKMMVEHYAKEVVYYG